MIEFVFSVLLFGIGYVIGSVPVGYIIARWRGVDDVRLYGSGATGATNVSRVLGKRYFFIVFALDFFKAYVTLLIAFYVCNFMPLNLSILAIGQLIGNGWPVFLGFRGGKGVATSLGILALLLPWVAGALLLVWFVAWRLIKNIGIASVIFFIAMICLSFYIIDYHLLLRVAGILGIVLHQQNISNYILYLEGRNK